ncbi:unnamed protein product [Closterium sp. NIES-65]|nr:unnamed protein product [Closterium sp. NIES-65]
MPLTTCLSPRASHHVPLTTCLSPRASHHVPLITCLSPRASHHVPLTTCLSPRASHHVPLTTCLSPRASHHVPLTTCLSPRASHHVPLTTCLSPRASHHVLLTTCLSPRASHHVPLTTCLSPRASHHVPLTTCLSPRASHHVPLTTCLSPRASHHVPLTTCLSPRASHHVPLTTCLSPRSPHHVPLTMFYLANNRLSGSLPSAISRLEKLQQIWLDNNSIEGPLPSAICSLPWLWRIDVSNNSLYGRINRNFNSMVADSEALINLAHNFFYGDAVLFAAGCQVCPEEITQRNQLQLGDSSVGVTGKCSDAGQRDYSVAGAGKGARGSLAGNCLTLKGDVKCPSNATQRSTAACQAFCSITDNGPCDGHGACVPPAPDAPANFTCMCNAGYSAMDLGNGSTCAILSSNTAAMSSLSAGAIVGIAVGCFAGFILLTAVLAWLLWPRGQRKWEGLDLCEQFSLQQLVRAMASLHHVNLVRLLGFCQDQNVETGKQEQILVYEFVANRDLHHHIYKTSNPLSLRQRLRLAQGAAEGLAYLHGFATPIIHRDIKPANILVTAHMHAKVADFGLLKQLTHGDAHATRVAGTPGYVDPDYNRTGVITAKSDVFSFGIVLLELLSGTTPYSHHAGHIRIWAQQRVDAYELDELKDSNLQASEEAVVDFADLALDCMKAPGTRRPDMKDVAYRLRALIDKHCPEKEEEWESGITGEESSTTTVSAGESSLLSSGSNGVKSWLSLRFSWGY